MSKFDNKRVMPRYSAIAIVMTVFALCIVGKSIYIATAKRDYWMKVAQRQKKDSVTVKPTRGNILSCDGQLMASSLPEYKLFMDFKALKEAGNDSLWDVKEDSICMGLSKIFPELTFTEFKRHIDEGRKKQSRHWSLYPRRINYNTFTEVKALPVFNLGKNSSGFHWEEYNARTRGFGGLAGRTIGALFGAKDTARFGLELSYDSILRGTNGIVQRKKVLNKYLNITDTPPIDGADIVTTINVSMQDLAERSLEQELKEINGNVGVAIVMEVHTGDVKAIVNLEKCDDGEYREVRNHAVSDLLEPGSVFKPASLLVALDDGVVDTLCRVETGNGVWNMYGRDMKDHNWRKGGYGMLTFAQTLWYSSNIGVSRIIDDHYHKHPEKFVQGIDRLGLRDNLRIPLVGSTPAIIRMPRKNSRGQYVNWSKTALPWMSIGYETQVPPISTLTFYNAVANNGKMVRPRFVTKVVKNGETIKEFPVEVMRPQIAKEKSIKELQTILEQVVSVGLGRKAGSPNFKVAGKTGTAQISKGAGGYKNGGTNYLVSFAVPFFDRKAYRIRQYFLYFSGIPVFFQKRQFCDIRININRQFGMGSPFLECFFPTALRNLYIRQLHGCFRSPIQMIGIHSVLKQCLCIGPLIIFVVRPAAGKKCDCIMSPPFFKCSHIAISGFGRISGFSGNHMIHHIQQGIFIGNSISGSLQALKCM